MNLPILAVLLLSLPTLALSAPPASFSAAKRIAEAQVYYDHSGTFYCGCDYSFEHGPDLASCGYEVRKQPKRAARIEWEHVMPAYDFGRSLQCWQDGGRDNCRATDAAFRQAEADLHNLVPTIGEVNGDRSNMRFAMAVSSDAYQYGQCQAKVDFSERAFEPPANVRGDVARTYWYMRDTHGVTISRQQQQLFEAWARQDPVDAWEIERNRRIANIQGNGNRYVSDETVPHQPVVPTAPAATDTPFNCSTRKTCGAMTSCGEALFHLRQCGNTRLDGDGDGTPCEAICR
ncbi:endonuclease [Halomonas sp. Bachu 37]|uniref:endonuclease n=1 Tax=Halomonas kashgarensis TaxID=3084920 RepID=UPI0032169F27